MLEKNSHCFCDSKYKVCVLHIHNFTPYCAGILQFNEQNIEDVIMY